MINFLNIWNQMLQEGTPVRPMMLMLVFGSDAAELAKGFFDSIKISHLIQETVKEIRHAEHWYQMPLKVVTSPHMFAAQKNVLKICQVAMGILRIWPFCLYIADFLTSSIILGFIQKPINAEETLQFIQKTQQSMQTLQRTLDKANASLLCGELLCHLREVNQAAASTELGRLARQLHELIGRMKGILENLADKDDPPSIEDLLGSSPLMKLASVGLRTSDFEHIATKIGWDRNESSYLPLRLAEKGIFSIKDLPDICSCLTNETKVDYVVEKLQYPTANLSSYQQRWKSMKQAAIQIDRIVALIFVGSVHLLTCTMLYQTPLIANLFFLVDGIYMAGKVDNIHLSRSDFVKGKLADRINWVFWVLFTPAYSLSYVTTKAIRGPGLRALPRMLYNTYLA